jgi:hypothetical protein
MLHCDIADMPIIFFDQIHLIYINPSNSVCHELLAYHYESWFPYV